MKNLYKAGPGRHRNAFGRMLSGYIPFELENGDKKKRNPKSVYSDWIWARKCLILTR